MALGIAGCSRNGRKGRKRDDDEQELGAQSRSMPFVVPEVAPR